jgi:hypothetical protein
MTIGGLISAFILLVISLWTNKIWLRNFVVGGVVVWFVFYFIILFAVSLLSEEKILNFNEPKEFCGFYLDCHMHVAVSGVRRTKTIGNKIADGEFYIVRVKISSNARSAELGLHNPQFEVVDAQNKRFERVEDSTFSGNPFERKVPAGGSFEGEVVFDLPSDVKNPRLDIAEGIGIDKVIELFLIGDEDSILHKRNLFKIETSNQLASN